MSVRPAGEVGDLAVVFDSSRRFRAIGLYDPASPIRIRVLHHGEPRTIDRAFFAERLRAALDRRASLIASGETTGFRWVHGENDQMPGLVIDRYGATAVVKLYSAAWFAHLDDVVGPAVEIGGLERVVLRLSRRVPADGAWADGTVVFGEPPQGPVRFLERGLRFEADVLRGQKTGHFLDQRENRVRVGARSAGARVLDVYSCTGGFSVHAAAGGARLVHSVDQSPGAIATARRNMDHNRHLRAVRDCSHHDSVGDAMEVMADMATAGRRFDVVVVDPPSFASRSSQVPAALRAYGRLTELAVALLDPGGLLVQASCSSRIREADLVSTVTDAADRSGVSLGDVLVTGHPIDHPIGFPQGAYLNAVFATVDR